MDDKVSIDELITTLCDVDLKHNEILKKKVFSSFWQQFFNKKYCYHVYQGYNNDIDNILSIINCHKPFITLNQIEKNNYLKKNKFDKKYHNIIVLNNKKATYLNYNKKNNTYIMILNNLNEYYPISFENNFIYDDIPENLKSIIDLKKIKINKIKLKELQKIASYYDVPIKNDKGKNIKKSILLEQILLIL